MEAFVAMAVLSGKETLGRPLPVQAAYFKHEQRHPDSVYRKVFAGAPVYFGASWTGAEFPADLLSEPLSTHDESVLRYLTAHADQLLKREQQDLTTRSAMSVAERVREAILQTLVTGDIRAETVAPRLGMSVRTLQRGLTECDTSFREELNEVRRGRAMELVTGSELSIQEISFLLGYRDARNFYRNFRRWTGMTPKSWRKRGK